MYIGIDESGNFETDGIGIHVATLIRPKHAHKIYAAYERWLSEIPESSKCKGEIKGWLLTNDDICKFARHVLRPNNATHIRYIAFQVEITDKNREWLKHNQKVVGLEFRRQAYELKQEKDTNAVQTLLQLAEWTEKHSPKTLFKIEMLGNLVTESIIKSLFYATIKRFDKETARLQVEIDESFGKGDDPRFQFFWRMLLVRQTFTTTHASGGVKFPAGWNNAHPFMRKFVDIPKSKGGVIQLKPAYADIIKFEDSRNSIPIQIADIIASTLFRIVVKDEEINCYDYIKRCNLNKEGIISKVKFANIHTAIISDKFKLPPPSIKELMKLKSIK